MNSTFYARTFLLFVFFNLLNVLTAQERPVVQVTENNVDSLEIVAKTAKDSKPEVAAEIYTALGKYYSKANQFQKSNAIYFELRQIAIKHDLHNYHSISYSLTSRYFSSYGKLDSMKMVNEKALHIAQKHDLPNAEGIAYGYLGNAYSQSGDRESAIMCFEKAIHLVDDEQMKLQFLNNAANSYHGRKDHTRALTLFQEALELARKADWESAQSIIYTNIGLVQGDLQEYDAAFENYRKGLAIKEKLKNYKSMGYSYRAIAETYMKMDSFEMAIDDCIKALNITEQFNDIYFNLTVYERLIKIYKEKGDIKNLQHYAEEGIRIAAEIPSTVGFDESMFLSGLANIENNKKNYRKALIYLAQVADKVFDEKITTDNLEVFAQRDKHQVHLDEDYYEFAMEELYAAQKGLGLYKEALNTIDALQIFRDSIQKVENLEQSKIIEAKFRVTEKENELKILEATKNAELKAKQAETNFYTTLAIGAAVLAAGLFFFMQRLRKQKKQLTTQNRVIKAQEKELRSLDELKSRFFANVSHEFRTPISLILGPISTILNRNKLENRDFTLLQLAKQNCSNLLKLIGEILDLTKLESGNLQLVEEKMTLYPTIRRTAASFQSLADSKGIGFRFDYQADQQLQVKMDAEKFKAILNNLLSNAFKFTPKGGQVNLAIHDQGQQLLFQVADTGKGIRQEDLPHIFNRFYQAAGEKETAQGGTGIGLALCNEYVKLFHGRLWVESTWDKGSTFYFEIPKKEMLGTLPDEDVLALKTETQASAPVMTGLVKEHASTTTSGQANKQTILIVEDNKDLQDYLRIILEEQYHILVSNNGQEALELLDNCFNNDASPEQHPSLVLSDVMMPLMDGFQLLEKIKQGGHTRLLPVIMLTARAELRDRLHALRIGVDDYMLKPFEEEELLVRVENLLRNTNERLATLSKQGKAKNTPAHSASDIAWLTEQESLLRSRLTDPSFTPSRWAGEISLSERQLQRKLKSLTGLSPRLYLVEMRLNEARTLLEDRQFSTVAEVAYAVGFNHAVSFTRNFKKRFGKLPSEYFRE